MYFLAIETTRRRLAEVSCSRASRPIDHDVALAIAQLGVQRHLGVEAHPLEQVGVVAGLDPALEGREGDLVAGPVVDRAQPDVVARVEVAVVDGQVRPVEQRQERLGGRRLVVGVEELLGLLEALLGPVGLGVAAGLDQVEVRRRHEQVGGARAPSAGDELVRLLAERQPVLRLGRPGLALGVVERPLVERDDALPGRLDHLLAELDGLGQDDLFLGGQQGDLADLLEVHPDRVVDPDHVGGDGLELLGGRLLDLLGVELGRRVGRQLRAGSAAASSVTTTMPTSAPSSARASGPTRDRDRRHRRRRRRRPRRRPALRDGRRPAILASSRSALARRGRDRTASTSCLSRGSADMGYLRWPASSRVWSRRRSSDRRASLICRRSSIRRSIASRRRRVRPPPGRPRCSRCDRAAGRPRARGAGARPRSRASPVEVRGSGPAFAYNARASAAVSSSSASSSAAPVERRVDALVVRGALEHDRPEELARDRARQLVRPELVDDPELLVRDEQEQPEQLRLDRRDRPQDVVDRQRVGRGQDGVRGDPRLASRPAVRPWAIGLRAGRSRTWRRTRSSTPDTRRTSPSASSRRSGSAISRMAGMTASTKPIRPDEVLRSNRPA